MKPTTPREKLLLTILPSFLVIAGYLWWFQMPADAELAKADKDVQSHRKQADNVAAFAQKRSRLDQLEGEKKSLLDQKNLLEQQWRSLTANGHNGKRSEKVENLASLLARHGLHIVEQGQASTGKDAVLPPLLETVVRRQTERGEAKLQVWRFRFHGTYPALRRVLNELGSGDPLAIPLSLTMKEAEFGSEIREWILVVWI